MSNINDDYGSVAAFMQTFSVHVLLHTVISLLFFATNQRLFYSGVLASFRREAESFQELVLILYIMRRNGQFYFTLM